MLLHKSHRGLLLVLEVQMIPSNRIATHPGKILLHEFLEPLGLTQ